MRTVLFRTISVVVFAVLGSNTFAISLPSFLKLSNEKSESAPVVPNLPPNFCSSTSVLSIRKNKTTSFSSIQAAVNASQEDAEIFVPQGVWKELVKVQHKEELTISTPCRAQIYGFSLSNSHRIDIQGFVIVGAPTGSNGIEVAGGNHSDSRINIANNEITSIKSGYSAISVAPSDSHIQITGNNIHNNQGYGIYFASAFFGGSYLIQGNTIINNGLSGITIPENTKAVISQNTIKFNGVVAPNTAKAYGIAIIKSKDCKDDDHKDHDDHERLARKISLVSNKIIFNNGLINKESTRDIGNFEVLYAKNDSGNLTTSGTEGGGIAAFVDVTPPIIIVVTQGNVLTNQSQFNIQATITDESPITVNVLQNGVKVASSNQYSLSYNATLQEGLNNFSIQAVDYYGNTSVPVLISNVRLDTTPPTISLGIANGAITNQNTINLPVTVTDASSTSTEVDLDGIKILTTSSIQFSQPIQLASIGAHNVKVIATDAAGNSSTVQITVTRIPNVPPVASLILKSLASGTAPFMVLLDGTQSTDPQGQALSYSWDFGDGQSSQDVGLATHLYKNAGSYVIRLTVTNQYGLSNSKTVSVQATALVLPPAPETLAPKLVQNNIKLPYSQSVLFLYSGANPTQTNVNVALIDPTRVSVLRGQVVDDNDQPISGVKVTVNKGSAFGQTLTREDGYFNMAINGGGLTTVQYEKPGYLPAQRTVKLYYNDFSTAEKAILIPTDLKVTKIQNQSSQTQVAKGTAMSDSSGQRTAVLVIPASTLAVVELPNGGTMTLPSLSLRMTEYTVGAKGPQRMPASLPSTSSYTYAVDVTADEALALGAKHISFSQPVSFYTDNFLGFPVGMVVPAGTYDYDKGMWVPSQNGRVIKVLNIQNGKANLDVTGHGQATASDLAALNITDDELTRIASTYVAGNTFWRAQVSRFSPFDLNVLAGSGGTPPTALAASDNPDEPPCQCSMAGSKIDVLTQNLGEELPVIGADFNLSYSSKSDGDVNYNKLIRLTGIQYPSQLQQIDLTVEVAGQKFEQSFSPSQNLIYTYTWNGLDAFGRKVDGRTKAHVTIAYRYPEEYLTPLLEYPWEFGAYPANLQDAFVPGREYGIVSNSYDTYFGKGALLASSIGQWTIPIYHQYDPEAKILYKGDGSSIGGVNPIYNTARPIDVVIGDGTPGFTLDGAIAKTGHLYAPHSIRYGRDRSIYFSDAYPMIRKITPDGIVHTLAGSFYSGYSGDGGPATNATFRNGDDSISMSEGEEGEYYIADIGNFVVRKIDKNGIITTIAGTGHQGFSGDNGPALQADLNYIFHIYYHEGSVFIIESYSNRIREITAGGIIRTIVGTGTAGYSPDGTIAAQAQIDGPTGLGFNKDGELFFGDTNNGLVRKINRQGLLVTVAGSKNPISSADGTPATSADIGGPSDMAVRYDGTVFWRGPGERIRYVATDGTLQTLAGNGQQALTPDGVLAKAASLNGIRQFDFSPEGDVYITEENNDRIIKIADPLNANLLPEGEYKIPSVDGSEIYYFDANGIHTKTTFGSTDVIKYEFLHDSNNNLIGIKDSSGNLTSINRDSQGNALSIASPYGQTTNFAYDSGNRLAQLQLPNGDAYHMTYLNNGLLSSFQKPNGATSTFSYDDSGKLLKDQDAVGGFTALQKSINPAFMGVNMTSAEGLSQSRVIFEYDNGTVTTSFLSTGEQISSTVNDTYAVLQSNTGSGSGSSVKNDPRLKAPAVLNTLSTITQGYTRQEARTRTYGRLNSITDYQWTEVENLNYTLRKTTSYDSASQTVSTTSAMGRINTTQLDSQLRPLYIQTGNLTPTTFQYDSRGRLTSTTSGTRVATISYGSNGMPSSMQDALGNVTKFEYDQNLRITREIYPNGRESDYQYDGNNNIISITPAGKPSHTMTFNPVDLLISYLPPSLGGSNTATTYQYNLDKKVTLVQRPDGQQIGMTYDPSTGLLTKTQTPNGSYNFTYNLGRMSSATSPDGIRIDINYLGSIATSELTSGPFSSQMFSTLNQALQVSSIYAGGNNGITINYGYDNDELLTTAGDESLSYDSNSLVNQLSLGNFIQTNSYNTYGELSSTTGYYSSAPIFSQNFTRDPNGRIVTLSEGADSTNYTYDNVGRLTDVVKNGAAIGHYGYDDNGNRTSAIVRGQNFSGVYDNQDRLISYGTKTYSYNAAGDLTSVVNSADSSTKTFVYDVFGNLKQANVAGKTINYLVDGKNRRVGKKINGTLSQIFVYETQTGIAAELDAHSNLVSRFIYASKSNVPDYMVKSGSTYRIISDTIGSVRAVVDVNTGAYAQLISYDEFGQVLSDSNPGFQPFGFAGGTYDRDIGFVRFGARDYDPEIGRWISKDPVQFSGDQLNLYSYLTNDPVNFMDPSGLANANYIPPARPGNKGYIASQGAPLIPDMPGLFNVVIHGTADYVILNGKKVSADQFAPEIANSPLYRSGQGIQLNACETGGQASDGGSNFAQKLSNILGAPVTAPTTPINIWSDGSTTLQGNGTWVTFTPNAPPLK